VIFPEFVWPKDSPAVRTSSKLHSLSFMCANPFLRSWHFHFGSQDAMSIHPAAVFDVQNKMRAATWSWRSADVPVIWPKLPELTLVFGFPQCGVFVRL
jgi:hypothetical protein